MKSLLKVHNLELFADGDGGLVLTRSGKDWLYPRDIVDGIATMHGWVFSPPGELAKLNSQIEAALCRS